MEDRAKSNVPYFFNTMSAAPSADVKEWAQSVSEAREDERLRVAQDLHDDLGGSLTGLKLKLAQIMEECPADARAQLSASFSAFESLLDRSIDSTRRISSHLRLPILDLGLVAALEWLIDDFNARGLCSIDRILETEIGPLSDDRTVGLFRICQEALNNAQKHAKANNILVALHADDTHLYLEIIDNGIGFSKDTNRRSNAFGLCGMSERALSIGATLMIDSEPLQGTCIRVTIKTPR
jgi:signal transduction histidine kinase